jgi:hypothetical protein
LQHGFDQYLGRLLAVRAFYDASVEVDPSEFALFTGRILEGQGAKMRAIWSPRIMGEDQAAFEYKGQGAGRGGFLISTWSQSGRGARPAAGGVFSDPVFDERCRTRHAAARYGPQDRAA